MEIWASNLSSFGLKPTLVDCERFCLKLLIKLSLIKYYRKWISHYRYHDMSKLRRVCQREQPISINHTFTTTKPLNPLFEPSNPSNHHKIPPRKPTNSLSFHIQTSEPAPTCQSNCPPCRHPLTYLAIHSCPSQVTTQWAPRAEFTTPSNRQFNPPFCVNILSASTLYESHFPPLFERAALL